MAWTIRSIPSNVDVVEKPESTPNFTSFFFLDKYKPQYVLSIYIIKILMRNNTSRECYALDNLALFVLSFSPEKRLIYVPLWWSTCFAIVNHPLYESLSLVGRPLPMKIQLPYEIWLHIFSFLHPKTIWQLHFVNTLFYNLSLNEYYRIMQVGYPHPSIDTAPLQYIKFGINLDLVPNSL